jgi:hypothetical protein
MLSALELVVMEEIEIHVKLVLLEATQLLQD